MEDCFNRGTYIAAIMEDCINRGRLQQSWKIEAIMEDGSNHGRVKQSWKILNNREEALVDIMEDRSISYCWFKYNKLNMSKLCTQKETMYLCNNVTIYWNKNTFFQDVVPARIVLLVTLCLVLINMFNSTTWVLFNLFLVLFNISNSTTWVSAF